MVFELRTAKANKRTARFEQATAQGQAHLRFAQKPPADQKPQKSLPFLPPAHRYIRVT